LSGSSVSRSSSRYKGVLLLGTHWAGFSSAIPLWGFGLAFVAFGVVSWYSSQGNEFFVNDCGAHGIKKDDQKTVNHDRQQHSSAGAPKSWDGTGAVYSTSRDGRLVMCMGCERSGWRAVEKTWRGWLHIQLEFQRMSCQPSAFPNRQWWYPVSGRAGADM
jgi:hypothetical protein